ncbi:hypothetical protein [Streptomyces sp. NPDC060187]|jgi:hypothetical protein|uniref:hypothetical protein n=1 Tax=Streptomyces sp. NPDC060187 TaxID=3347067 RepID=UPI00364FD7D3
MSEVDERFDRWAERLRKLLADTDEDARQAAMDEAMDEMWIEDKNLIAYWENCIDGCCPTGELVLVRLVHPQVSAPAMVRVFPELIRSSRTHRAVIFEEN